MADTEFEQFRQCFERLPQHIKTTTQAYTVAEEVNDGEITDIMLLQCRWDFKGLGEAAKFDHNLAMTYDVYIKGSLCDWVVEKTHRYGVNVSE
ncbi:hypothetical protein FOCC_FOCC016195, partial [Frankliniella occidentalis]